MSSNEQTLERLLDKIDAFADALPEAEQSMFASLLNRAEVEGFGTDSGAPGGWRGSRAMLADQIDRIVFDNEPRP